MELYETVCVSVPPVDDRLATAYAMHIEVKGHEIGSALKPCRMAMEIPAPVRHPIARRKIQNLLGFLALHEWSARIEIERGTPPPHDFSQRGVARGFGQGVGQRRSILGGCIQRRRRHWAHGITQ